jgi:N-acetyl-gamma-glutamyl-phosphate reductase
MIKIGIIGGAGYTAGELIRLLLNHPDAEIVFINSVSHAGVPVSDVHEGLFGETELCFTSELPLGNIDLLFFCTGHGDTKKFIDQHREEIPEDLKIIDLSMDYRLMAPDHDFVYGLPELNRREICSAKHVANPGCFATCIQLGLLPLAKHLMIDFRSAHQCHHRIHRSRSEAAGDNPFLMERQQHLSIYKPFVHQHLPEIYQSLHQLQNSFNSKIWFIPMRGDFPRGIFATSYIDCKIELDELKRIYEEYYSDHSFTFVTDRTPDLKQVVNTNKCLVNLQKIEDKLLITTVHR